MISRFRPGVNEILAVLGCYVALIGSYRRFGTASLFHLEGSRSLRGLLNP